MSILPFTLGEFFTSVIIIILFIVAGKLLTYLMQKYVKKWTDKTKTEVDDVLVQKFKPPFSYVIWFLGLKLALRPLHLDYSVVDNIVDTVLLAIATYAALVIVDIVMKVLVEKLITRTESTMDDALVPLINSVLKAVVIIVGILWILSVWSINITPFLASLGIAGLALGFAVKDSLANIFGGVSLILDQTIKVGDKVKLESGEMGFIVDMSLRSTKLQTFNNELITIPNGQLANSRVQNFGKPDPKLKVTIDFGVSYDAEVDEVRRVIYEALSAMEGVMDDPPVEVLFLSLGDFALNFSARFWVADFNDAWAKQLEATDKIFKVLKANKIKIPYPTRTVHVKK